MGDRRQLTIEITFDENGVTNARMWKNEPGRTPYAIKVGSAMCHPDDKFDPQIGAMIAMARMFGDEVEFKSEKEEPERKLTDAEKAEIEKTLQEAKAKADAAMKGIKTAVTVEFKTETQAIMKMDMKVNEEALKQAGVNWAKRKALRAILAIAPSSEKTTYVVKGNLVIMSPTDEPDTLRISNDGKYLYGKFDKDFEVKLTRTK